MGAEAVVLANGVLLAVTPTRESPAPVLLAMTPCNASDLDDTPTGTAAVRNTLRRTTLPAWPWTPSVTAYSSLVGAFLPVPHAATSGARATSTEAITVRLRVLLSVLTDLSSDVRYGCRLSVAARWLSRARPPVPEAW